MTASTDASATPRIEQVGGSHYKTRGVQHWDVCVSVDLPYLLSAASKYVARHRAKDGREGLQKAVSYLERHLLAVDKNQYPGGSNRGSRLVGSTEFMNWISDARMQGRDTAILHDIMCAGNSQRAIIHIRAMIEEEYPSAFVFVPAPGIRTEDVFPPAGTPEDGGHHEPRGFEPGVDVTLPDKELLVITEGKMTWRLLNRRVNPDHKLPPLPITITQHEYDHRTEPCHRPLYEHNVSACRWVMKPEFAAHWGYVVSPDEDYETEGRE